MSILDDAIREHLELKRAHGADEGELKKLEDEAFGPPQRPDEIDPFNEAPTEFLVAPGDAAASGPEVGGEAARGGRLPNITDLQEAPPVEPVTRESDAPAGPVEPVTAESGAPPPSPADAAEVPLPPPADEAAAPPDEEPAAEALPPPGDAPVPADEEHPAAEHEIVPEAGPDIDERHLIADQPTQMFDVQTHIDAEAAVAPTEQESPTDDELVDAARSQPPSVAPPAPDEPAGPPTELDEQPPLSTRGPDAEVTGHPPSEEESAEFDFFNEQRLSDELDQALEAPLPPTDEHALPDYGESGAQGGIFDFESGEKPYEEDPSEEALRRHDEPEPPSEEHEQPAEEAPRDAAEPDSEESGPDYDPDTGHEDVLEDTPRFLEDAPEDDDLWFEQKPPKDFDLD